jgi:hypothetical protein
VHGAGAAAAAAAAVAKAVKASGAMVRVEPDEFRKLLGHNAQGLVVHAVGGLFSPGHKYLMGYRGLKACGWLSGSVVSISATPTSKSCSRTLDRRRSPGAISGHGDPRNGLQRK